MQFTTSLRNILSAQRQGREDGSVTPLLAPGQLVADIDFSMQISVQGTGLRIVCARAENGRIKKGRKTLMKIIVPKWMV